MIRASAECAPREAGSLTSDYWAVQPPSTLHEAPRT